MTKSDDELRSRAETAFKQFHEVYFKFDDFWKRSNTFDGAIQFVAAARRRWSDLRMDGIDDLITQNQSFFGCRMNDKGVWQDDYGWCGAACLSARDYCKTYGDDKDATAYSALAEQCWDNMASYGWDASDTAKPVPHGCQNRDRNHPDGTKNTVTNATFLRLSLNLYAATKDKKDDKYLSKDKKENKYLQQARASYLWFDAWFNPPGSGYPQSEPYRMVPRDYPIPTLIAERPWAAPDYHRSVQPDWEPGWVWTGDQGLMLAALAEYCALVGQTSPTGGKFGPFEVLEQTAWCVDLRLFDADGVVQEAPFDSSFGANFAKDYVGGRGVLMRHLGSDQVRRYRDFSGKVMTTADAAWASRDAKPYPANWNPGADGKNRPEFPGAYANAMGYGDGTLEWDFDQQDVTMQAVLKGAILDALGARIQVARD
jgi:hypothetical protein